MQRWGTNEQRQWQELKSSIVAFTTFEDIWPRVIEIYIGTFLCTIDTKQALNLKTLIGVNNT